MPTKSTKDMKIYAVTGDGEYKPIGRLDNADIDIKPDTMEPFPSNELTQATDIVINKAPIAFYRIMQPANNYLRMHGYKPFRYRNLIRVRKRYGTDN